MPPAAVPADAPSVMLQRGALADAPVSDADGAAHPLDYTEESLFCRLVKYASIVPV
jgi:hypothetical protein